MEFLINRWASFYLSLTDAERESWFDDLERAYEAVEHMPHNTLDEKIVRIHCYNMELSKVLRKWRLRL